jgi:hypothetical protein
MRLLGILRYVLCFDTWTVMVSGNSLVPEVPVKSAHTVLEISNSCQLDQGTNLINLMKETMYLLYCASYHVARGCMDRHLTSLFSECWYIMHQKGSMTLKLLFDAYTPCSLVLLHLSKSVLSAENA